MKLKIHGLILLLSSLLTHASAMDDLSTTDEEYSRTSAPNNTPNLTPCNTVYENKRLNRYSTLNQIPAPILTTQLSESSDEEIVDIIPLTFPLNIDNRMTDDEIGKEISNYTKEPIGAVQLYYYPYGIPNAYPPYTQSPSSVYNPFIIAGDAILLSSISSDIVDSDNSDDLPFKME
ncbi:MAG: hypothetical protein KF798_01595 [Candidatus Paracaedibacteraceae bacterium]|nr:hypothetical protein [Candidatus Paracaedibacteraceae bacterium]